MPSLRRYGPRNFNDYSRLPLPKSAKWYYSASLLGHLALDALSFNLGSLLCWNVTAPGTTYFI